MSKSIKNKFIDRGASRLSSPSSSGLPMISMKRLDSFTISLRRHSNFSALDNPESEYKVAPARYDATQEIEEQYQKKEGSCNARSQIQRYQSYQQKRESPKEASWLQQSMKMREKPSSELYLQRVGQNLKQYGAGMLRRAHRNSLGVQSNEQHLLQLHYRLKKERQLEIITREQRKAAARFRSLLSRYESI